MNDMLPVPDIIPVATFRTRRLIFALNIRTADSQRSRPYSTRSVIIKWINRLCSKNGLVSGSDYQGAIEEFVVWEDVVYHQHTHERVGPWWSSRERTVYLPETYAVKEPVVKRRLIIRFDAVYVGDCPKDIQDHVKNCQSSIQVGRQLKVAVLGSLSLLRTSSAPTPAWLKGRNDSYFPEKLRW